MAAIIAFLKWLFSQDFWIDPEQVNPPIQPPVTDEDKLLLDMMNAIKVHEGDFPGSRSRRNNNAGNVKFSPVGYLAIYEPVKMDKDGFAIFKDYNTGWLYLRNLILSKARKHPEWNLSAFFREYAPPSENNDTARYATVVAQAMGVSVFN